jgi:hypothetical protein
MNIDDERFLEEEYGARVKDIAGRGVVVMDWSVRGNFNGIGNEIQHYLEMILIGLATDRAAFVQTQRSECEGTNNGTYEVGISERAMRGVGAPTLRTF